MQRWLSKEESRQRYAEGRKLWNEFDPIGVANEVDDEYDNYVGPCLRIVEAGEDRSKLVEYVNWVVFEHMGLNPTMALQAAIGSFAMKFIEWYGSKWPGTVV